MLPDLDTLWDYPNPVLSEERFRTILPDAESAADLRVANGALDDLLQLLTQISRAECLQRKYAEAHATLDRVDRILDDHSVEALAVPRVRLLLERGRCFNDTLKAEEAKDRFHRAWELAIAKGFDFYAVDAAHMLGIVETPKELALEWNERAVAHAKASSDPKARRWQATLQNNIGWTYHEMGRYADALVVFEDALKLRIEQGKPGPIRIARWAVARTHRQLGRIDEALATQRELLAECETNQAPDGYVHEELAECLHAQGQADEARPHFGKAYELLSKDPWFPPTQPERLARLQQLGDARE